MVFKNLTKKKQRVISYFIDAATKIVNTEGIQGVSIRKVAQEAGYNSATLYNYFSNLEQLLELTVINCITDYLNELSDILESKKHDVLRFLEAWECYCKYSFSMPSIFIYVFASSFSERILENIKIFVHLFPNKFQPSITSVRASTLLDLNSTQARNNALIQPCIDSGYFTQEKGADILTVGTILHAGLLYRMSMSEGQSNQRELDNALADFHKYYIDYINQKRNKGYPTIEELLLK